MIQKNTCQKKVKRIFLYRLYFKEDLVSDTGFLRLDKGNVVTINGCDGYALPTLLDRFDYQRPKK